MGWLKNKNREANTRLTEALVAASAANHLDKTVMKPWEERMRADTERMRAERAEKKAAKKTAKAAKKNEGKK